MMRTLSWCLAFTSVRSIVSMSCLDETGANVDWWFMLKHPAKYGGDGSGTQYVFVTSHDSSSLKSGSKPVTDTSSLLGKQMAGIYAGGVDGYVFYNDQMSKGLTSTSNATAKPECGHSKGFFAYDSKSAFWVQHSIPHFPNFVKDGYLYGSGQEREGQHAFCMTMSPENINDVAAVMKYSNGGIYDHKSDGSLSNVEDIVNGRITLTGTTVKDVTTTWGTVKLFGKTVAFNRGMVADVVAPALEEKMLYQSWLNTGGPLGPSCPASGADVVDVKSVKLSSDDTHPTHVDHSKWTVAKDPSSSWFCGVDNNHVKSQYRRSGLAACVQNSALSGLMRGTVAEADTCGGGGGPSPGPSPRPPSPSPPSPSPAPGPPSPPAPLPGKCCYKTDAVGACSAGEVCCTSKGAAYGSASSCSRYGSQHKCAWANGQCAVGGDGALVLV